MLVLVAAAFGLLLCAALTGLVAGRHGAVARVVHALDIAATALVAGVALTRLLSGAGVETAVLPLGLPWVEAHLRLDPLTDVFLLLVGGVGVLASVYGLGYDRPGAVAAEVDPVPRSLPLIPAFLAAMLVVPIAADAFTFLLGWEAMSVMSWLLVLANHRQPGQEAAVSRAAFVYLVMAGFGAACLLLAFGLMAAGSTTISPGGAGPAGETGLADYAFATLRATPPTALAAILVPILVVLGCGSKAGLAPLHVWLPLAHPAAPSHVSALMSAAMTKVAIYGVLRILLDLQSGPGGAGPHWGFAAALMLAGGLTAVAGVLQGLMQRDLKRLLAYSTVENIGVVMVGIGLCLAFKTAGQSVSAALALVAALFHALNHAVFKSLMFMGAGAVMHATGERDLERLGGLASRMPITAATMLLGAAALAALPPLNGFASEWLMFRAVIAAVALPQPLLKLMVPVVGALLALATALAAAAMVKAYGATFLGQPRHPRVSRAHDPHASILVALIVPAILIVVVGVVPALVTGLLLPAAVMLTQAPVESLAPLADPWFLRPPVIGSVALPGQPSEAALAIRGYAGAVLVLLLALAIAGIWLVQRRRGWTQTRIAPTWDCGFPNAAPAYPGAPAQYTAASLAQPLRRVLASLGLRARERVEMPEPGDTAAARILTSDRDPAWVFVFDPLARAVIRTANGVDPMRHQGIRHYLALVFATLVVMLLVVALTRVPL